MMKFKGLEEEISNSIDNLKLSCENCGEMFKTTGLLRRPKKMLHNILLEYERIQRIQCKAGIL